MRIPRLLVPAAVAIVIAFGTRSSMAQYATVENMAFIGGGGGNPAGTVTQYTTSSAWQAAGTVNLGTETFAGRNGFYPSPVTGSVGSAPAVDWTATAPGGFFFGNLGGMPLLSTNQPEPLTITFSGEPVSGVGGAIFDTDINFFVQSNTWTQVKVSVVGGSSQTFWRYSLSISDFWGFHSTGAAIQSIEITAGVPVPAPGTLALLGACGFVRSRRRR